MKTTPEIAASRPRDRRAAEAALEERLRRFRSGAPGVIDVATDQGFTGRSYIFAYATMTQKPLVHLDRTDRPRPRRPRDRAIDLMAMLDAKFRLLGWQGLVGHGGGRGLDMAFWDALGQAAGKGVVEMLGGSARPMRAYDSYGVVDPVADERDLRRFAGAGFSAASRSRARDGDAANGRTRRQGRPHVARPRRGVML